MLGWWGGGQGGGGKDSSRRRTVEMWARTSLTVRESRLLTYGGPVVCLQKAMENDFRQTLCRQQLTMACRVAQVQPCAGLCFSAVAQHKVRPRTTSQHRRHQPARSIPLMWIPWTARCKSNTRAFHGPRVNPRQCISTFAADATT
jgi:hypothetical protein